MAGKSWLVVLLVLSLDLAGCGFRPAGPFPCTPGKHGSGGSHGALEVAFEVAQQLRLEAQGLSDDAPALRLRILEERFDERPLTITSGARVGEFELITTVRFDLLAEDGTPLWSPRPSSPTPSTFGIGASCSDPGGSSTLRREMVQRLARRLLQAAMVKRAPWGHVAPDERQLARRSRGLPRAVLSPVTNCSWFRKRRIRSGKRLSLRVWTNGSPITWIAQASISASS